ncbi:hypothetical protein ACFPN7_25640 [Amycolatopsis halotolerans]|uniref:hypothetical protein n=1 Tax=Amycolatopsis halotolerans TaxID=330083 RepID=UPI0036085139
MRAGAIAGRSPPAASVTLINDRQPRASAIAREKNLDPDRTQYRVDVAPRGGPQR